MTELFEITEQNWQQAAALCLAEEQQKYLDTPLGILARGYACRTQNARVYGIAADGQPAGLALVKEFSDEPLGYDLQQFLIDRRFQGRGHGTAALGLILERLCREGRYDTAEVCVDRTNTPALRLFQKAGFADTGYLDPGCPGCLCLSRKLCEEASPCSDRMITDFTDPLFTAAFQRYFSELGVRVRDWEGLFREMNAEGTNAAFVRTAGDGRVLGFLMFRPEPCSGRFFEETLGFIREFWVSEEARGSGHGTALLRLAERHLAQNGIRTSILTTHTAAAFYEKRGYQRAPACRARNGDAVFIKHLW